MESDLMSLFAMQSNFLKLETFTNEFETMSLLYDQLPDKPAQFLRGLSLQSLENMERDEDIEFSLKTNDEKIEESKNLRQQGNRLFTAKGDKRNVLAACRLYNDAIYAALDTKGEELALGFANRATALQTFGYYQQAYDDCLCAIQLGYPDSLKHKITTRQTYCSIQMRDLSKAEKHLNELRNLTLSKGFEKEREELIKRFETLRLEIDNKKEDEKLSIEKEIPLNRESQEIVTTTDCGRIMRATRLIEKNQLIFTERASAFVPVGDTRRLCHQCGTVNFIPIPCFNCRGRVNYCSLKCKTEHQFIHDIECPAYRFQLFAHVGIAHLALRIILDNGLFAILDDLELTNNTTTLDIWSQLTEGGVVWTNTKLPYAESLRMITHLNKVSIMDIKFFAMTAHHLVVYLKRFTKYFEILQRKHNGLNWELLTASLILRHIGQCISNAHTVTTIIPNPSTLLTTTDFHMLNENIWSSPWHLKLGFLQFFSHYDDVASINFPYLNLCNHSCVQSFQPKISGRYISTFALRNLNKGDEITNFYDVDYRKGKQEARREKLLQTYHFECKCENCTQPQEKDKEFNKFHQYRCDNSKCKQIFVPDIPERPTLNWWQGNNPNDKPITTLYCTFCGQQQSLDWYFKAKHLMATMTDANSRRRLYQIFKDSSKYLLGLNDARSYLATKFVREWFKLPWVNIPLNNQDYLAIIDMNKYVLSVIKAETCMNSIEYVVEMTYMWELMAKRKYKCSKQEMDEMLWALSIIADDLKVIYLNYYNDYIKDYINK